LEDSAYVNLDFVLGSAADERLWNQAKYCMSHHRKRITPQLFESLVFLKYNKEFWTDTLIIQAYRNAQAQKSTERYAKLASKQKEYEREMEAAKGLLEIFKYMNID
jgi:hypothetical protein